MSTEIWASVDDFFAKHLVQQDAVLEQALKESENGGLPAIQVALHEGKFLQILAKLIGAKRILEIGTLGGYSTIWLARALPADGSMVTLEFEPKHAEVAARNIAHAGLSDKVEVIVGAALDSLERLQGSFDFIFIDADKPNNPGYFKWALKLSHPGTLIVVDNVVRGGKVGDPANEEPETQGVRKMFEMIEKEPRVSASAVQTVGRKGYDGFALIRVER
ncbi:MAG TPA: O-methyltransferase [Fimbriimonadaceae bacterium]|jgi:predicted O-methyltransferase YrrM